MGPGRQVLKRHYAEQAHSIDKMQKLAARAMKRHPDPKPTGDDQKDADALKAVQAARRQFITKHAPPAPVYRPYVAPAGRNWKAEREALVPNVVHSLDPIAIGVETSAEELEGAFIRAMEAMAD